MSISDRIVVMSAGVIQQIGKPQEVYDDPINLFVAKFLGTPAINVFDARVEKGMLVIGKEAVLPVPGAPDGEVFAAIRPEGFVLRKDGRMTCSLNRVEVMGRDISVVSAHENCHAAAVRAIISAENMAQIEGSTVHFDLKPAKVHLFDKQSEARIRFEA